MKWLALVRIDDSKQSELTENNIRDILDTLQSEAPRFVKVSYDFFRIDKIDASLDKRKKGDFSE